MNEQETMTEMLSENFSLQELTRTNHTDLDNTPGVKEKENLRRLAQQVLQPLRDSWGQPLKVNSAYRSPLVNSRVHGAASSYHLRGLAADIDCATDLAKAMRLALACRDERLPVAEVILSKRGAHYWLHVALKTGDDRKKAVFTMTTY